MINRRMVVLLVVRDPGPGLWISTALHRGLGCYTITVPTVPAARGFLRGVAVHALLLDAALPEADEHAIREEAPDCPVLYLTPAADRVAVWRPGESSRVVPRATPALLLATVRRLLDPEIAAQSA